MSYLSPRLSPLQKARRLLKTLLYGPRGMEMGPGSSIGRPWTITNPSFVRTASSMPWEPFGSATVAC